MSEAVPTIVDDSDAVTTAAMSTSLPATSAAQSNVIAERYRIEAEVRHCDSRPSGLTPSDAKLHESPEMEAWTFERMVLRSLLNTFMRIWAAISECDISVRRVPR